MNVIAKKYKIVQRYGKGQFSTVCRGICLNTNKNVAIKMERNTVEYPLLKHEVNILYYLAKQKCKAIPNVHYYGFHNPYTCLVMTFYNQGSLEQWIQNSYSPTVEEIWDWWNTAVEVLQHIHKAGIVHRDLKPAHFMRNEMSEWHLIDFGLATTYLTVENEHIEEEYKPNLIGTPLYVSYYVHQGRDVTRRDDFLSLVYIAWSVFFQKTLGSTPPSDIMSVQSTNIENPYNQWLLQEKTFAQLYRQLEEFTVDDNDQSKRSWIQHVDSALRHVESLSFTDRPNYKRFFVYSLSI